MKKLWTNMGELLTRKLATKSMAKLELARLLAANENTVYGYCSGQYVPEPTRMRKIQDDLDISDQEVLQALLSDNASNLKEDLQRRYPWFSIEEIRINAKVS